MSAYSKIGHSENQSVPSSSDVRFTPQKRTCAAHQAMSAKGHKRTWVTTMTGEGEEAYVPAFGHVAPNDG